jgi:hypothetical protein
MIQLAPGWELDVDRGPDWLFVRVRCPDLPMDDLPPLADAIWRLMTQHFCYRLVLELNEVRLLHSRLLGQLVLLHKRLANHEGGMLRVCGLSPQNRSVLEMSRLERRFPNYENREQAVMGHRPAQPR